MWVTVYEKERKGEEEGEGGRRSGARCIRWNFPPWGFVMIDGPVCPEIIFVQLVRKQPWRPCRVPITTACVNSVKHQSVNDDEWRGWRRRRRRRIARSLIWLRRMNGSTYVIRYPLFPSLLNSRHVARINPGHRTESGAHDSPDN